MNQVNKTEDNAWIDLFVKQVGEHFAKEKAKESSRKAVLEKELAKQPQK
jgi:hypothetical protein